MGFRLPALQSFKYVKRFSALCFCFLLPLLLLLLPLPCLLLLLFPPPPLLLFLLLFFFLGKQGPADRADRASYVAPVCVCWEGVRETGRGWVGMCFTSGEAESGRRCSHWGHSSEGAWSPETCKRSMGLTGEFWDEKHLPLMLEAPSPGLLLKASGSSHPLSKPQTFPYSFSYIYIYI